jgi:hypothetical protein
MTTTRARQGKPLHFPPPGFILDSTNAITAPTDAELRAFADAVASKALPLFVCGLMRSARRRRYQPRWAAMNRARIELARLCLDRMMVEGLDAPTPLDLHLCMACP